MLRQACCFFLFISFRSAAIKNYIGKLKGTGGTQLRKSPAATLLRIFKLPCAQAGQLFYVGFPVCKRRLKCWLCVFLFSRQNGAERKGRFFTFFLPPFSNHSARHRLPLLGYPLSGKSTRQLSNYKRKKYWLYKLSIYFSDARFHMLFGFPPANGQESGPLVCPRCRPRLPAHSTSI